MATCRIQALMVSGHPMASAMNCCLSRGSISWWSSEEAKLVAGFMRFLGVGVHQVILPNFSWLAFYIV